MSSTIGRTIFTNFYNSQLKRLSTRGRVVRYSSASNDKSSNLNEAPKPVNDEPGKITAAVLRKFTEPLVLETVEPPKTLKPNEVLVDVRYCALNAPDALLAKNMYTLERSLPMILGYEFVGNLVRVGDEAEKQGYKVGDKIIALNKDQFGGLADQCIAQVTDIWKVPSDVKSEHAVAILDDYVTALIALERNVSIQEEDIILINVGVSGIGLAAVDLATNVFKAQVISVCATEDGASLARDKGVLASFRFKDRKLLKQLEELAAEKDIKHIFEDADGVYFKNVLNSFTDIYKSDATIKDLFRDDNFGVVVHHLSREGRVIIAGSTATNEDSDSEDTNNAVTVSGFNLREYRRKKPETYREAGDDILQFLEEGLINPTVALTVGLAKVNDALEFILNNKNPGKVIVNVKDR